MATITEIQEKLKNFQVLLRENRAQEVDNQINELSKELIEQLEKEKAEAPPPSARTPQQLMMAVLDDIAAKLGNHPSLQALLTELRPAMDPHRQA